MKKYKKITNAELANKWLLDNYEEFIKENQKNAKINNTLGHALYCYTGSMSRIYNDIMFFKLSNKYDEIKRKDYDFLDNLKNVDLINNSFDKNEITEDLILYHFDRIDFNNIRTIIDKENDLIETKRFFSTTLIKKSKSLKKLINEKKYNSIFIIKVKKGTKCIPILWDPKDTTLDEYEIILKPTQKIRFVKKRRCFFSKIKHILYFETE